MSSNPHTPGSSGSPDPQVDISAEMQRAKEEMLSHVLGSLRKVNNDTRRKLFHVLGEHVPVNAKAKNDGFLKIRSRILPNRMKGDLDLSPDKAEIIRIMIEKNMAIESLLPEAVNLSSKMLDMSSGRFMKLKDLLLDPDSSEARWVYQVYRDMKGWNIPEWKEILSPSVPSQVDIDAARAVEVLREEYAALCKNTAYHNLQSRKDLLEKEKLSLQASLVPPPPPPPPPGGGSPVTVNVGGNQQVDNTAQIQQAHKRITQIHQEISVIDGNRSDLENRLKKIDRKGFDAMYPPSRTVMYTPSRGIAACVGVFGEHVAPPFDWAHMTKVIDGNSKTMEQWMIDDDAVEPLKKMKVRAKRGNAKISASDALNEMLRVHYAEKEKNASPAEIDAMVKQMRTWIGKSDASQSTTGDDAAGTKDRKKFFVWRWLGAAWNKGKDVSSSVGGYLWEKDKTLLGFPVQQKKD